MSKILDIALNEQGVREYKGLSHNPRILQYSKDIGVKWVQSDETAWCSIFINWCAKQVGADRSMKLNARSWLTIGSKIEEGKQLSGDVAIFWRESVESWKGHVALYVGEDAYNYYVVGGNQDNMVRVSGYPKSRLLEFRRLK